MPSAIFILIKFNFSEVCGVCVCVKQERLWDDLPKRKLKSWFPRMDLRSRSSELESTGSVTRVQIFHGHRSFLLGTRPLAGPALWPVWQKSGSGSREILLLPLTSVCFFPPGSRFRNIPVSSLLSCLLWTLLPALCHPFSPCTNPACSGECTLTYFWSEPHSPPPSQAQALASDQTGTPFQAPLVWVSKGPVAAPTLGIWRNAVLYGRVPSTLFFYA